MNRQMPLTLLVTTVAAAFVARRPHPGVSPCTDSGFRPCRSAASSARSDPRHQRARRLVYYRALKSERGRLDRYVASLNVPAATYQGWSREQQMAFWLNAYNAFVLQTVIDHYPIQRRQPRATRRQHPADPGRVRRQAPRRRAQRHARRDREDHPAGVQGAAPLSRARPRRGRQRPPAQRGLHRRPPRSSSSTTSRRSSCRSRRCSRSIGRRRTCRVTPIMSWREAEFVAAYDKGADGPFAQRSPIERADRRLHHAAPAAAREGTARRRTSSR